jgi:hypothetical protein
MYRIERLNEMGLSHANFHKNLDGKGKKNLKQCITHMALESSVPDRKDGLDRQLFAIIKNQRNENILSTINPIARMVFFEYHGLGLVSALGASLEKILKNVDLTNDLKRRVIALYFITRIELEVRRYYFLRSRC